MASDDERPMRLHEFRQLFDVFLLGAGALLGITAIILASGASPWFLVAVGLGAVWLAWIGTQLLRARRSVVEPEPHEDL